MSHGKINEHIRFEYLHLIISGILTENMSALLYLLYLLARYFGHHFGNDIAVA